MGLPLRRTQTHSMSLSLSCTLVAVFGIRLLTHVPYPKCYSIVLHLV